MEKTISGDKRENPTQSRKQISSEIAISIAKNRVHSKLGFEFGNFDLLSAAKLSTKRLLLFSCSQSRTMSTGTDETMDRLFPKPLRKEMLRSTYVMFDAEDFSIPDPLLFKKNIVTAIEKEGYRGRIRINGYFGPKITIPQDLLDQYLEAGIYSKIFEGDRVARMNMMLVELLFWAMSHYPAGTNVLIITKNQKILEEHKVRDIIEALAVRDFYFAIEHPDTFYPPAACAESSELFIPIATRKRTLDG
ncbi:unnamed protein product [Brassica napus]|nr:unnamed protein product [Brassica napus]